MRWVRRGGAAEIVSRFVYFERCKQKVGEKKMNTMVQTNAYNSIYLSRYVYSVSFVFLRLCRSHQLLHTLTKYVST